MEQIGAFDEIVNGVQIRLASVMEMVGAVLSASQGLEDGCSDPVIS